jgi:hypothetical protein
MHSIRLRENPFLMVGLESPKGLFLTRCCHAAATTEKHVLLSARIIENGGKKTRQSDPAIFSTPTFLVFLHVVYLKQKPLLLPPTSPFFRANNDLNYGSLPGLTPERIARCERLFL